MISIIIGSESDRKIAEKATAILEEKGIKYDLQVISAHRNYKKLDEYLENSNSDVFIAIAGLSAALPGIIAAKTKRPVILSELSDYLLKKNGSSSIEVINFVKSLGYIVVDAETPEIRPEIKEFTNILCIPKELGV